MTSLASNALTSLRAVKSEMRLTTNDDDLYLRGQINFVSQAIEDFLGRALLYDAARVDLVPGYGGNRVLAPLRPVLSLTSVEYVDGDDVLETLDVTEIEIEDADAGWVYRRFGFPWTVPRPTGTIARDPAPGHERRSIRLTYAGGYVLPNSDNPTLPASIERAAILAVVQNAQQRGRDRSIKSERLMSYSVTYGGAGKSTATAERMFPSSPFSDEVTSLLMPFRDVAQA